MNATRKRLVHDQLAVAQDYLCGLCGGFMERLDRTLDHILPRSLGGSNRISNLRLTHRSCNERRAAHLAQSDLDLVTALAAVRGEIPSTRTLDG